MAKKIAVINDLSGFGRCSLTAALPVISVMGSQPCPLPTAVLSAQTGYPDYYLDDYTDRMDLFREKWAQMGETFDGIYTGFVANEAQIDHIFTFLDTFYKEGTFLLVDPVMGDDGTPYPVFSGQLLEKMRRLTARANVITPNLTELCLLAGRDYSAVFGSGNPAAESYLPAHDTLILTDSDVPGDRKLSSDDPGVSGNDALISVVSDIARSLRHEKPHTVIVTGIPLRGNEDRIANLVCTEDDTRLISFPRIGGSFSGTGDLFASVLAGGIARGDRIFDLCELAGRFIAQSMTDSIKASVDRNAGTEFERNLWMLFPKHRSDLREQALLL